MRRTWLVLLLAVAAAALVAVPAVGLAAVDGASNAQTSETNSEVAPGERLSGVVGVGEAEVSGDHEQRALAAQIAAAETTEAQADAVAERLSAVEQRLDELEQRRAELDEQRAAGEISEGRYRAEIARLAAKTETVSDLGNRTGQVAGGIPTELLEERGVDASRIQQIANRADNLTGPEVAEIARGIAGNGVGDTPASNRPVEVPMGPPGDDRPRGPPGGDDRPGNGGPPGDERSGGQSADDSTDDSPRDGAGERSDAGANNGTDAPTDGDDSQSSDAGGDETADGDDDTGAGESDQSQY